MAKMTIDDLGSLQGKRALVRVDFNVPLKPKAPTTRDEGVITDDRRIRAALPTIQALIAKGAKVVLMSHLGRPDGQVVEGWRLDCVAKRLGELLGKPVQKVDDCVGPAVEAAVAALKPGDVLVLENTRFHAEEESKDDAVRLPFAQQLAKLGDVYVNDAFGTAHRDHASTASVARYLRPAVAGYLMQKEIEVLGKALGDPERPFVGILGGAKVKDKLKVISNLLTKVDTLLIGGGMAYTFYKAEGYAIGDSLLDADSLQAVTDLMKSAGSRLVLPIDTVIATAADPAAETKVIAPEDGIPAGWQGLDIGPKSVELFATYIKNAKLVVWNGPVGYSEIDAFANGTIGVAKALAESDAYSIIGGGDSAAAAEKLGFADRISFISTGGGASLEFLEGRKLPGVECLDNK